MQSARGGVAFICVTVALDALAASIVIPVLPQLIKTFLGGDLRDAATVVGLFVTVLQAMQFLFAPLLGMLSDRFGRRPVILASNFGLGFDYILMAVAPSLGWLWVGRVFSGMTTASIPSAHAYLADVLPPEKRAGGFGLIHTAYTIGFALGAVLGGALGQYHLRLPFLVGAALSLTNATYGLFVLPESLPREKRAPFSWKRANPLGSIRLLASHRQLLGLAFAKFLQDLADSTSLWVLYADYRYGWKERSIGVFVMGWAVTQAVVQGVLAGRTVRWLGERRTVALGLVLGAIGFAIFGWAPTGIIFAAGVVVFALWGLEYPAAQALMSRTIAPSEQGQLQGALASQFALAGMGAPLMYAYCFAWTIDPDRARPFPGLPFFISSAFLLLALGVALIVTRRDTKPAVSASDA